MNLQNFIVKLKQFIEKKWKIFLFGFYLFSVFFLFNKIPINPDEYLYASIGNNFVDSFRSEAYFGYIDTYHTFLLPLIISIFNLVTGINSFFAYRIVVVLFSVGFIYIFYKIYESIFSKNKNFKYISLFMLLLFPGYFYYSGLIITDNLASFFFACLIYFIIKKENYWKIGVILLLLFLSKEYYVVFGIFTISIIVLFDSLVSNKRETVIWKMKYILKNLLISISFTFTALLGILLFPFFPYPNLLGSFMLEMFGNIYVNKGACIKELIYGTQQISVEFSNFANITSSSNVVGAENFLTGIKNIVVRNIGIAENSFKIGAFSYIKSIFVEVHVNLYVLPLVICGIFIRFYKFFSNKKDREKMRLDILMLSILIIFFAFFARTATTGEHGFRIALIVIIPFVYFATHTIGSLIENKKLSFRKICFLFFSFLYVVFWLITTQKNISGSILYNIDLIQIFIKYKFYFNLIFYAFPLIFVIFKFKLNTKKTILFIWLLFAFFCKLGPIALNSYLVKKNYAIDYNLALSKEILRNIEKEEPRILTNYERAYYFYSNSTKMPNDIRKNLPIIRPKPNVIYEKRVFNLNEDNWATISGDLLCEKNIDYIFFVNNHSSDGIQAKRIADIEMVTLIEKFYKNNNLNWIIYKFDKKNCK